MSIASARRKQCHCYMIKLQKERIFHSLHSPKRWNSESRALNLHQRFASRLAFFFIETRAAYCNTNVHKLKNNIMTDKRSYRNVTVCATLQLSWPFQTKSLNLCGRGSWSIKDDNYLNSRRHFFSKSFPSWDSFFVLIQYRARRRQMFRSRLVQLQFAEFLTNNCCKYFPLHCYIYWRSIGGENYYAIFLDSDNWQWNCVGTSFTLRILSNQLYWEQKGPLMSYSSFAIFNFPPFIFTLTVLEKQSCRPHWMRDCAQPFM